MILQSMIVSSIELLSLLRPHRKERKF
uniref:Uncharacterized protein n=1 Tax=Arundo donax TaxID=35708 RepID=A0A0A9AEP0_ARUDO